MYRSILSIALLLCLGFCATPVLAEQEVVLNDKAKAKSKKEYLTLFTGINRSREVFEILKELSPDMIVDGDAETWTKIQININQGNKKTSLTFNHDKTYYSGKKWQIQKLGMYNYFSKFPKADHKDRALRLIKRLRFAVASILEPPRIKDDKRLALILKLSKRVRAIMFAPGSLMDSSGRIIISLDGYSDPEAKVDL